MASLAESILFVRGVMLSTKTANSPKIFALIRADPSIEKVTKKASNQVQGPISFHPRIKIALYRQIQYCLDFDVWGRKMSASV